jgi:DNA invertase Pin-like site-specific DNA recombinase
LCFEYGFNVGFFTFWLLNKQNRLPQDISYSKNSHRKKLKLTKTIEVNMTIYAYLSNDNVNNNKAAQETILSYANKKNMTIDHIELEQTNKSHWMKRKIAKLVQAAKAGDSVIVFEAADLAPSTAQVLEVLTLATQLNVNIHFAKYTIQFAATPVTQTSTLIHLLQHIDNDFISRRTTEALARRRAAGLALGRPKGRKNKSLKLDQHKKDILKYLDLAVSKTSIAKLIGCHPQTLYDWIDRRSIADKKARKTRKISSEMQIARDDITA